MYKLRQTWNEVFPVRVLYDIDVSVKKIDPAWPITAILNPAVPTSEQKTNKIAAQPSNGLVQNAPATTIKPNTASLATSTLSSSSANMLATFLSSNKINPSNNHEVNTKLIKVFSVLSSRFFFTFSLYFSTFTGRPCFFSQIMNQN